MKITVLPIKWFALIQNDVFIDVIKSMLWEEKRMAPTSAKFIERIICEGFFDYSLGGCYLQKYRMELFPEIVD
jgi:hypothetical protein